MSQSQTLWNSGLPSTRIETEKEWFGLLSRTVFAPRGEKPAPAPCAKPIRCEACPYPQPCDEQTVQAPAPSPAS